jgi:proline-specific peptidase
MFITINGQNIFFDVVGAKLAADGPRMREKPTLLVLHGGPGFDHSGLRGDFDGFADIAQVVYLDHRGNGRSVPSDPRTWTLAQWGDDIAAFCDALGIVRPIIVGQSFGGMVAQAYATQHPDHPRALVLSSTAARMDLDASLKIFAEKGGAEAGVIAERFWTSGAPEDIADYMRVCMPLYNKGPRPGDADARERAIMRFEVYRHFSLPGGEIRTMDFRAALRKVSCPVLVVGGEDDPITPPALAREIATSLPNAELRLFDNAGHGAFRDDPARVLPVIRAFVEKNA